ncbi:hypothetical protein CLD22_21410, partial [Rubrivivax gelatinosus]|nr:hypothetical protein [Rubrivivax gelatinosus]
MPPAHHAGRLAALLVLPLVLVAASGEPTPASRPTSEPAEATPAIAARQAAAASAPAPALPH